MGTWLVAAVLGIGVEPAAAAVDSRLLEAFRDALSQSDPEAADQAWAKAIELAPTNSAAWSNRGTLRLQNGRWQAAYDDLLHAYELETAGGRRASAVLANNLGNTEGALGRWEDALGHYMEASDDPEKEAIALANYALAAFELGRTGEAIREARVLLRRDANFLDARCALVAFLWADGQENAAEAEWETLQLAQDGLGGELYSRKTAVGRVAPRWPPRPAAALAAFVAVSRSGSALGYDGSVREYKF